MNNRIASKEIAPALLNINEFCDYLGIGETKARYTDRFGKMHSVYPQTHTEVGKKQRLKIFEDEKQLSQTRNQLYRKWHGAKSHAKDTGTYFIGDDNGFVLPCQG